MSRETPGGDRNGSVPVDMQHHEGLADALKLEVHDRREGSTHQLTRQLTHLYTKTSTLYMPRMQSKTIALQGCLP